MSINTTGASPDSSAMLDVSSTSQGFLMPRMTQAQRMAIASPANGLMIYQIDGSIGLYIYDNGGGNWEHVLDSTSIAALFAMQSEDSICITDYDGSSRVWINEGMFTELMRIHSSGNVGIGTASPNEKLDVEGSTEIDGDYWYESAKNSYMSISSAAFTPLQAVDGTVIIQNIEIGGFLSGNARWLTGGISANDGYMFAPVSFPDSANIQELVLYIYDNDATYEVYGELRRQPFTVTSATTTTGQPGNTSLTDNTISHTVDNSNFSYYLAFYTKQDNNQLRIYGARLQYSILKAQ